MKTGINFFSNKEIASTAEKISVAWSVERYLIRNPIDDWLMQTLCCLPTIKHSRSLVSLVHRIYLNTVIYIKGEESLCRGTLSHLGKSIRAKMHEELGA